MSGRVRSLLRRDVGVLSRVGNASVSVAGVLTIGALLAGCSSDISRFDFPAFGLMSDNPQRTVRAAPAETIPDRPQNYAGNTPYPAPPPDYGNGAPQNQSYAYQPPPAAGAYRPQAYGAPAYGQAAPGGFGTVPGQPESYKPGQYASNGQTAYVTAPSYGAAAPIASMAPMAPAGGDNSGFDVGVAPPPRIMPPVAGAVPPVFTGRRPKAGAMVTVLPGETLVQVARRNGVSVAALMQTNHLRTPVVQPGQQLAMPGHGGRSILPPLRPEAANAPPDSDTEIAAVEPAAGAIPPHLNGAALSTPAPTAPSAFSTPAAVDRSLDNADGSYTVRAGDSIYSIARKHGVRPEAIASANGLNDVTKINFGQTLRMPGAHAGQAAKPASGARVASVQPVRPAAPAPAPTMNDSDLDGTPDTPAEAASTKTAAGPMAIAPSRANGPVDPASKKIASADPAPAGDVPSDGRFRWPVRGHIIGQFGPGGKAGTPNEGIDLAVPQGTEVHAAENGVVAYAGDELKGYGKLVLIRHADNWVTAYAHNDELLVKRGDAIRRGQVIAKSGKSGGVDQPLLHFELRKGSQPVDPMPHMASN
jgi:murein DD-endopeptidase MepM/ murein hydrolase activator NlpD